MQMESTGGRLQAEGASGPGCGVFFPSGSFSGQLWVALTSPVIHSSRWPSRECGRHPSAWLCHWKASWAPQRVAPLQILPSPEQGASQWVKSLCWRPSWLSGESYQCSSGSQVVSLASTPGARPILGHLSKHFCHLVGHTYTLSNKALGRALLPFILSWVLCLHPRMVAASYVCYSYNLENSPCPSE